MARKATILLVEDDLHDVELFMLALGKTSSIPEVITLQDGPEAILYLSGEGRYADREKFPLPTLVLLDLSLPLMSGFEVLRWMREQSGKLTLPPTVVLSYSQLERDKKLARELGAQNYLIKPTDPAETVTMLQGLTPFWTS
jgi:DNA-binding response OmpR family regulator